MECEELTEVIEIIEEIGGDTSVPKNVKQILTDMKKSFEADCEIKLKVDDAMQRLEELSINPNILSHTRTQLWNITSVLEDLSKTE